MANGFLVHLDGTPSYSRLDLGSLTMIQQVSASDQLYVGDATGFAEFAVSSAPAIYAWKSGDFLFPRPENFSAGVVDAAGIGVAKIYADGALREEVAFHDQTYFRLRSGPPAWRWSVEITGSAVVRKVDIARSFAQLRGV